jgi:hypothetical protein
LTAFLKIKKLMIFNLKKQILKIAITIIPFSLCADQNPQIGSEILIPYTPWFTGPLLAPTPINMQPSHPAIEPSITIFKTYGRYDSHWSFKKQQGIWAINPLVDFQFAITDTLGIETLASFITNLRENQSSTHFQDTIVLFGYQISNDIKGSWVPNCRIILQETFPTGKYQKLNPHKYGIDSTGMGSFQTGPVLVIQKLFYFPHNFLSMEWSIGYLFPSKVNVKGFNAYGGGYHTKGKIHPGQTLTSFISGEYSINQNWVFAFDTEFLYQRKSHFSGKKGYDANGNIAKVGLPSSMQISFAPEIEYNFKAGSGLLAGIWFSVAGKNSSAFASAFLSYLYVF